MKGYLLLKFYKHSFPFHTQEETIAARHIFLGEYPRCCRGEVVGFRLADDGVSDLEEAEASDSAVESKEGVAVAAYPVL